MKKPSGGKHVKDLLGPYLDAELDDKARARVEQHLDQCGACRRELESLQALHQMVKRELRRRQQAAPFQGGGIGRLPRKADDTQ